MASARVDIAPKKARVLSPGIVAWVQHLPFAWPLSPPDAEEQRALDEKQGRVERDRSKQLHGYDGGWWAKKSPYLGAKDGGSALIAVRKDQVLSHSAARAEARRGARLARRAAGWRSATVDTRRAFSFASDFGFPPAGEPGGGGAHGAGGGGAGEHGRRQGAHLGGRARQRAPRQEPRPGQAPPPLPPFPSPTPLPLPNTQPPSLSRSPTPSHQTCQRAAAPLPRATEPPPPPPQLGWADAVTFSDLGERSFGPQSGAPPPPAA